MRTYIIFSCTFLLLIAFIALPQQGAAARRRLSPLTAAEREELRRKQLPILYLGTYDVPDEELPFIRQQQQQQQQRPNNYYQNPQLLYSEYPPGSYYWYDAPWYALQPVRPNRVNSRPIPKPQIARPIAPTYIYMKPNLQQQPQQQQKPQQQQQQQLVPQAVQTKPQNSNNTNAQLPTVVATNNVQAMPATDTAAPANVHRSTTKRPKRRPGRPTKRRPTTTTKRRKPTRRPTTQMPWSTARPHVANTITTTTAAPATTVDAAMEAATFGSAAVTQSPMEVSTTMPMATTSAPDTSETTIETLSVEGTGAQLPGNAAGAAVTELNLFTEMPTESSAISQFNAMEAAALPTEMPPAMSAAMEGNLASATSDVIPMNGANQAAGMPAELSVTVQNMPLVVTTATDMPTEMGAMMPMAPLAPASQMTSAGENGASNVARNEMPATVGTPVDNIDLTQGTLLAVLNAQAAAANAAETMPLESASLIAQATTENAEVLSMSEDMTSQVPAMMPAADEMAPQPAAEVTKPADSAMSTVTERPGALNAGVNETGLTTATRIFTDSDAKVNGASVDSDDAANDDDTPNAPAARQPLTAASAPATANKATTSDIPANTVLAPSTQTITINSQHSETVIPLLYPATKTRSTTDIVTDGVPADACPPHIPYWYCQYSIIGGTIVTLPFGQSFNEYIIDFENERGDERALSKAYLVIPGVYSEAKPSDATEEPAVEPATTNTQTN